MTAKLVQLLYDCGITPIPRAKVLEHFLVLKTESTTSREIERKADLRQPEVSVAISAFLEKKWIKEIEGKETPTKGRPEKRFVLAQPPDVIYKSIAASVESEAKKKANLLEELKAAMIPVNIPVESTSNKKEQQERLV